MLFKIIFIFELCDSVTYSKEVPNGGKKVFQKYVPSRGYFFYCQLNVKGKENLERELEAVQGVWL